MDGSSLVNPSAVSPGVDAMVFTTRKRDRLGIAGIGVVFLMWGLAHPFYLDPHQSPWFAGGLIALLGAVLLFLSEGVLARRRLILSEEGAEYKTLLGTRRLAASQIKGFRTVGDANNPKLVLIPAESATRKLTLPLSMDQNGTMREWATAHFPDLDAIELQSDLEAILADDAFGFTVEERQGLLKRQRLLFKVLSGVAFGVALWAWIFPRPYEVAIGAQLLVALVALACGALGRGLLTLWPTGKAHPTASIGLSMPGLTLLVRAVVDIDVDSWQAAILPIAAGSALWVFLIVLSFKDTRKSLTSMRVAAGLALLLGAGSALQWNVLADNGEPLLHETVVVDKRASLGQPTAYTLLLAPWKKGEKAPVEYSSKRKLYERAEVGQPVWVWTEPGALGIPWYHVSAPQE